MTRTPTWPVAALSLVLGFAVAELTGVRPIGGVVLVLGAGWCGLRWRAERGLPTALGLVALYLVCFALSHVLGHVIGSWPSVAVVAAIVGAAAWWWGDGAPGRSGGLRAARGAGD